MKNKSTLFKSIAICLTFMGFLLIATTLFAQADLEDAEFVGVRECADCHAPVSRPHRDTRHHQTLQEVDEDFEGLLADFAQGEALRRVAFPDGERPFTREDVAYVIGSGRYVQRFLYALDENEYRVFPAEWNVATASWQPFTLAASWDDPAYSWNTQCAGCHTTGLDVASGSWQDDGVQCEACHGAGSLHVEAADDASRNPTDEEIAAIRAAIVLNPDAQTCGSCHSRGSEGAFAFPVSFRVGVNNLLDSFTLVPADDPVHWWVGGQAAQANMQYNEWLNSAHASAISAEMPEGVACTTCHHPHAEEAELMLTEEPEALCTACHTDSQAMYEGVTRLDNIVGTPSSHLTAEATCTTCHLTAVPIEEGGARTSHTFQPVLPSTAEHAAPDTCTSCHTDLSAGYLADFIQKTQTRVHDRLVVAQSNLPATAPIWVRDALTFVAADGSMGVHNLTYTNALLNAVETELGLGHGNVSVSTQFVPASDPSECQECHSEIFQNWRSSPHANASLNDTFLQNFASQGRPNYCMNCHASGYDINTGNYAHEGVVCSACHQPVDPNLEHPPAPLVSEVDSASCGRCHSGAHAPTYDEWLLSKHKTSGVDCVDCHTPHNNGLILGDVNATCGDCHQEALVDEVHMGDDMTCVDCHMNRRTINGTDFVLTTGHSMSIDPSVCSACHGNTHLLSARESGDSGSVTRITTLEGELDTLQKQADRNRSSGIVGGALGTLIVLGVLMLLFRWLR